VHYLRWRLSSWGTMSPREGDPMPYLYILECADKTLYVGSTTDLDRRLAQHSAGEGATYTKRRLPVRLLYSQWFDRIDEAFAAEKQVQGWSRRKRQALIEGRLNELPTLSHSADQPDLRR
jgi:putative endonuclease